MKSKFKSRALVCLATYVACGITYYYLRHSVNIELTSSTFRQLYLLSILLSTFGVIVLSTTHLENSNRLLKIMILVTLLVLLIHNSFLTFMFLGLDQNYVDDKIIYTDPDDSNRKIIEQYLDEGAFGSHRRIVEVHDIFPGFRMVYKTEKGG